MNGNVHAAPPTNLELSVEKLIATTLADIEGYGKVEGATLEVSFNEGEQWEPANLKRLADNKWEAKFKNSKNAEYVSLRATAWDDLGNKISQDIIKAYGLK